MTDNTAIPPVVDPAVEAFKRGLSRLRERFRSSIACGDLTEDQIMDVATLPLEELQVRSLNGRTFIRAFSHCLDDIPELSRIQGVPPKGCADHRDVRRIVQKLLATNDTAASLRRIQDQDDLIFELRLALSRLQAAVSACTLIKGESATMDVEKANVKARLLLESLGGWFNAPEAAGIQDQADRTAGGPSGGRS